MPDSSSITIGVQPVGASLFAGVSLVHPAAGAAPVPCAFRVEGFVRPRYLQPVCADQCRQCLVMDGRLSVEVEDKRQLLHGTRDAPAAGWAARHLHPPGPRQSHTLQTSRNNPQAGAAASRQCDPERPCRRERKPMPKVNLPTLTGGPLRRGDVMSTQTKPAVQADHRFAQDPRTQTADIAVPFRAKSQRLRHSRQSLYRHRRHRPGNQVTLLPWLERRRHQIPARGEAGTTATRADKLVPCVRCRQRQPGN